jgi:hypothetical protein
MQHTSVDQPRKSVVLMGKRICILRVLGTAHACYWCACACEQARCCRPRALDGVGQTRQYGCDISPPGRVCLPLMQRRPFSSFTKPSPTLPRPDAPRGRQWRGELTQAALTLGQAQSDPRSLSWLSRGMRDTVIQHHHGKHSIGTLKPRIADLRNAAGIATRGVVRFRHVFDGLPFPMRRRESR